MAVVLSPDFVHVYHAPQCRSSFAAPSRRAYAPRHCSQLQRPQQSLFSNFIGQLSDLLGEIDQHAQCQAHVEAQRALHREQQQRKHALPRAHFSINQGEKDWQIDGNLPGFERENIHVEVLNDHTLKIIGNTRWRSETLQPQNQNEQPAEALAAESAESPESPEFDNSEDVAITEAETATISPDSKSKSQKPYQATAEDDFEDLGVDASLLWSGSDNASGAAKEQDLSEQKPSASAKRKEKEMPGTANGTQDVVTKKHRNGKVQENERVQGSFERTFRFAERIDVPNVRANFEDGALSVVVPKAPKQVVRQVAVLL